MYPRITYYWTVPLILDHSYLIGNLINSKIAEAKVLEPLKSWHFCISSLRTGTLSNNRWSGGKYLAERSNGCSEDRSKVRNCDSVCLRVPSFVLLSSAVFFVVFFLLLFSCILINFLVVALYRHWFDDHWNQGSNMPPWFKNNALKCSTCFALLLVLKVESGCSVWGRLLIADVVLNNTRPFFCILWRLGTSFVLRPVHTG